MQMKIKVIHHYQTAEWKQRKDRKSDHSPKLVQTGLPLFSGLSICTKIYMNLYFIHKFVGLNTTETIQISSQRALSTVMLVMVKKLETI